MAENVVSPSQRATSAWYFGEIIAIYCQNETVHINKLCAQNARFFKIKSADAL